MPSWLLGLKRPLQLGFAAAVVAALVSLFLPNYYRSEARILPVEAKGIGGGLGNLASAAAAFGVSVPGGDSSDANFLDILQSRWLRERLLNTEFRFKARAWRFGKEAERRETLYAYLDEKNLDRALLKVGPLLGASRDLKSKVILVWADTKSPELSQLLVRRSIQLLEEFVQQKGRTRGGAKAAFAEARLAEAREETSQAEDAFRRFLEGNRNYQTSTDPTVRIRGARLEAELKLRMQLLTTLALNREQALMEEKNDVPILNVMDGGNLPLEKSRPKRSIFVLLSFLLVSGAAWAYANREWIRARLMDADDSDSDDPTQQEPK